jgi:NAD(P)-dependent dehydrogenase (short-subunit alcohol dehydrogenase family)
VDLGLAGKSAVVTGAGRGIGLAITAALAEEGASVTAGSRTITKDLEVLAQQYAVHPVAVDLGAPGAADDLVNAAVATFGGIDVLVNNVGAVHPRLEGFLSVTDDEWDTALELNLLVAARTCRAALPHLLAHDSSSIVTISSVNASLPDPLVVDYSAAKGALTNLMKSLSKEFGPRGVRVTTVSPGPVETDLWLGGGGVAEVVANATGGDPHAVAQQAVAGTATRRFTRPSEVADLVVALAGDRLANLTGVEIVIDGGLTQSL